MNRRQNQLHMLFLMDEIKGLLNIKNLCENPILSEQAEGVRIVGGEKREIGVCQDLILGLLRYYGKCLV